MMVSIFCLVSAQHPVRAFDPTDPEDARLIQDIRKRGVVKPLRVTRMPEVGPFYLVIDGLRRLNAAAEAGLVEVPVTVEDE